MRKTVIFVIEERQKPDVRVRAISEEHAFISISASTMQEAIELLPQGEEAALEAMRAWTPEEPEPEMPESETPGKEMEHYKISPITIEKAARQMKEYEASATGSRFKKSLEISKEFTKKNESEQGSLGISQMLYLCNMCFVKDTYSAILTAYDLAFRKGYMTAKNHAKKKAERKGK